MDFNGGEIVLLLLLAIVIFGPEKLPELARKSARLLHHFRRIANDAQGRLRQELGPEFADLELRDLNPKAFVAKHLGSDAADDLKDVADEFRGAKSNLTDALHDDPDAGPGAASEEAVQVAVAPRVTPFDPEAT